MPTSKEARAFYARPFESGVTTLATRKSNTFTPRMCAHCGSVKLQAKGPDYPRYFCDVECRSEFKKIYYKSADYQAKCGIDVAREVKRKQRATQKQCEMKNSIKCCTFCGEASAMKSWQKFCLKCRKNQSAVAIALRRGGYKRVFDAICVNCGVVFSADKNGFRNGKMKKFCSSRCCEKSIKKVREHRKRVSGPSDRIELGELIRMYNNECASCGKICINPTGFNLHNEATVDHIIPIAVGGVHTWDNVQLLCRQCNSSKSDYVPANTQLVLPLTGGKG